MKISNVFSRANFDLNYHIWEDEELRVQYKAELVAFFQSYINQNESFTRSDFQRSGAYNVFFIPTSESYNKWGQYITVINPPIEAATEVFSFNATQTTESGLVKKYATIYGDVETHGIVNFNVKDVYEIEG